MAGLIRFYQSKGVYMAHSSTVQVLKVVNEMRKSKKGEDYTIRMAECVLLTDEGEIEVAGPLRLSEELVKDLKPGFYRAGFSMVRSTYGDNKGDIVSKCVSLTPVPTRGNPASSGSSTTSK